MAPATESTKRSSLPTVLALIVAGGYVLLTMFGLLSIMLAAPRRAWESLQEGGWMAWVLLLASLFALFLIGGYGALVARHQRLPSWPTALAGCMVALLGVLGVWLAMSRVDAVLMSAAIDPSQRATIFAAGLAESLIVSVIGALFGCLLLSCAAAMIGTWALGRAPSAAFGKSAAAAVAAGGVAVVLAGVVSTLIYPPGWTVGLATLAALSGFAAAVLGALGLDSARANEEERSRACGGVLHGALAGVGAAVAAASVAEFSSISLVFGAVASAGVDGRVELLARGWDEARQASTATLVYAAPPIVAAAAAMAPRLSTVGRALAGAWLGAGLIVVLALLPGGLMRVQSTGFAERLAALWASPVPDDVELAEVPGGVSVGRGRIRELFVGTQRISLDGRALGASTELDTDAGCEAIVAKVDPDVSVVIGVDATTPYRRMWCLARALATRAEREKRDDEGDSLRDEGRMGRPRGLDDGRYGLRERVVDPEHIYWLVQPPSSAAGAGSTPPLRPPFDRAPPPRKAIVSRAVATTDTLLGWAAATHYVALNKNECTLLDLGSRESKRHQGQGRQLSQWLASMIDERAQLFVLADAEVPARTVLAVLGVAPPNRPAALVSPATGDPSQVELGRAGPAGLGKPRDLDAGASDAGAPRAALRFGHATVKGQLDPAIIRRFMRRRLPPLRHCYQRGLDDNPTLEGRLTMQFTVGPNGQVSQVRSVSSTLSAPAVAQCIGRVLSQMRLPPPEGGGTVLVTQPLVLSIR